MSTAYYTATQNGNWNDSQTWGGQELPNPVIGDIVVNIPIGKTVTIPNGYTVNFTNALLQIIGGKLAIDGEMNVTRDEFNRNDHSISDGGSLTVGIAGKLNLTVQGNQHSLTGFGMVNGTVDNKGDINITCKTTTSPSGTYLAYGISVTENCIFTNNGTISISSPDNIPNGGYGPSFGIYNRMGGTLINNSGASIVAQSTANGQPGGGIIANSKGANFQNNGQVHLAEGIFLNQGSFSGSAIGKSTIDPASADSWSSRIGPICGNSEIIVILNDTLSWYSEASSGNPGLEFTKGGTAFGEDIASSGYNETSFVAVGPYKNKNNQTVMYKSTSGMNWEIAHSFSSTEDVSLNAITYGDGEFTAVGEVYGTSNGEYAIGSSTDWDTGTITNIVLTDIAYGDIGSGSPSYYYLGVSFDKTYTSKDGKAWEEKSSLGYQCICYRAKDKFFYGITKNTGEIFKTGSGSQWKKVGSIWDATIETNYINDFMWSEDAQLFIAVGSSGSTPTNGESPSAVFTSPDGITWSENLFDEGYELLKVGYGAGLFVAAGYLNTIIRIYASAKR